MTDFYAQLEDQLVGAARRRQAQGRVGRAVAGRGRTLIAATAAIALLAAGGAVALPSVLETSSTSEPATPPQVAPAPAPAPVRGTSLNGITVAVLNGTTRTGVARAVADQLERRGATVAATQNAPDQAVPRSLVLYAPGAKAKARRVAIALGGAAVRPVGGYPGSIGVKADVTIVAGSERIGAPAAAVPVPATPRAPSAVPPAATTPARPPSAAAPPAATPVPSTRGGFAPAPTATVPAPSARPAPPGSTPVAPPAP